MTKIKKIVLVFLSGFLVNISYAQDKCATDELPVNKREPVEHFEQWIKQKRETRQRYGIQNEQSRAEGVLKIPVVVHVIHKSESIGTGSNISDAQIISQIEVLNEDFRRQNADASNTPSVFQPVATDIEVEFVLALQDPDGLPTDGIVRVEGSQPSYHPVNDQFKLSSESYWPAEDYFNIWVTDLESPYLGYAQFPVSDLPGLEGQNNNRHTDGIAIDYLAFGSKSKYPDANLHVSYNLGRTTTHEVGHFLGLRHIWGDGDCATDDYCNDTPATSKSNSGYGDPCTFPGPNSCGSGSDDLPDMFQNYMDYTNDQCMNLFTLDQKTRIQTVLSNSPRRFSLTQSKGLEEPALDNIADLSITQIVSPTPAQCGGSFTPSIEVKSKGSSKIGTVEIAADLNGEKTILSHTFTDSLEAGKSEIIEFPPMTVSQKENTISFEVVTANGLPDKKSTNNRYGRIFLIDNTQEALPLREDFDEFDGSNWHILNMDNQLTWEVIETRKNNLAAFPSSRYFNQQDEDWLLSPILDFSDVNEAALFFDLTYSGDTPDRLQIFYTDNCGETYKPLGYDKQGSNLSTYRDTRDFLREYVSLEKLIGLADVRLAFVATSGHGSNIEVDNIEIFLEDTIEPAEPADIVALYPNPSSDIVHLSFKLNQKEDVKIHLIDYSGRSLAFYTLPNTLNQTHQLDFSGQSKGVYIVKIIGQTFQTTKRLVIY